MAKHTACKHNRYALHGRADVESMEHEAGRRFAWKRVSDGVICQTAIAATKDDLFESAGFGAVRMDESLKGMLAVEVAFDDEKGEWVEKS